MEIIEKLPKQEKESFNQPNHINQENHSLGLDIGLLDIQQSNNSEFEEKEEWQRTAFSVTI